MTGLDPFTIINFTPSGNAAQRIIQALTGAGITTSIPLTVAAGR